jgi:hypothetical protein
MASHPQQYRCRHLQPPKHTFSFSHCIKLFHWRLISTSLHALYSRRKSLTPSSQPQFRIKFLDGQLKRHQYSVTWQCTPGTEVTTCSTCEGWVKSWLARINRINERKNLPTCHTAHHKSQMKSSAAEFEAPIRSIGEVYSRLCHLPALAQQWHCRVREIEGDGARCIARCRTQNSPRRSLLANVIL